MASVIILVQNTQGMNYCRLIHGLSHLTTQLSYSDINRDHFLSLRNMFLIMKALMLLSVPLTSSSRKQDLFAYTNQEW